MFVGIRRSSALTVGTLTIWRLDRRPSRQAAYLWAWLLIGYLILTLVPNKGEERYAQPLLPPMALLLGGAYYGYGRRWVRRTVIGFAVIIGGLIIWG